MSERPDQMKKMKTKEAPKAKTSERGLKDMGIEKSKEVKFDAPAKPKADGSKNVAKSKVDAVKAKQAKKTQKATDRAAKKTKAPSMRAEKRAVRKDTRQQVQDIKREGRQERKAIRRGMAQSGLPAVKPLGSGIKPITPEALAEMQRNRPATPPVLTKKDKRSIKRTTKKVDKILSKGMGGKKDKMKDRRR